MSNGLHSWVTYASNSFFLVSSLGSGVNQSETGAVLKTFSLSTLPKSSRTKQKTAVLDWKHTLLNRLIRQGTSPSWFPGIYRSYFCNSGVKKSIGIFKSVHVHRLILSPRYLQLSWAKEDRRTLLCSFCFDITIYRRLVSTLSVNHYELLPTAFFSTAALLSI